MPILPDIFAEMHRLIDAAREKSILLRAIGGLAIRVKSGDFQKFFTRDYRDLDFVVGENDRKRIEPFFQEMGYASNRQFNLLNGSKRQIYQDPNSECHVDIFVGNFEMCHKLPMNGRLEIDPVTVPLAELLLSKAQIVQLNRKDALDIAALLLYNETGQTDDGKINLDYIAKLCGQDWGLYKTTAISLNQVEEVVRDETLNLTESERDLILKRVSEILHTFEAMPKSLAWQMRDKVGTRVRWYEEVEEVRR
ncbi:MAG TPA: hypothetical protein VJ821_15960 [Anaerolineales bacterium]|nr:hypothetical protein [Anaerolineales bacterium]